MPIPAFRMPRVMRCVLPADFHRCAANVVALTACVALPVLTPTTAAHAQGAPVRQVGNVPRDVAREVATTFNAPTTRRIRGDYLLASTDTVRGSVAVLDGNARIGGVITGQLVVINGDATLETDARIDGSLTILGGTYSAADRASVTGDIRVWSARLRYREDSDTLIVSSDRELFTRWARWERDDPNGSEGQLFLTTAHTYNRVEGLPIYLGPRVRVRNGDTRVTAEVYGIFRTGVGIDVTDDNLGHRVRLELRQGRGSGVFVGGRSFDEIDAIESWQLNNSEVGLASFVFTRDYRDYWRRHGAQGYVGVFGPANTELRATFGEERWSARRERNVPSLIDENVPWRINPRTDQGVMRLLTLNGSLDTRNRADDPRSGWWLQGEFEHGSGTLDQIAPTSERVRTQAEGATNYSRALLDLRRYNRLGPGAQFNVRAVAGGWLSGDPLPIQRRFSVSGIDALPGFDFRQMAAGAYDVGTCATGDPTVYIALGRPAQCERMLLLQAEWKGDFRVNLFGDDDGFGDRRWMAGRFRADGAWVLFANSGRGWLASKGTDANELVDDGIPPLNTWHTDIGGGFDFGSLGVYVAKSVSRGSLPANVYVRLGRRF